MKGSSGRRKFRRDAFRALAVVAAVALAMGVALFLISRWQRRRFAVEAVEEPGYGLSDEGDDDRIEYEGAVYVRKEGVSAYLILGIDVSGPVRSNKSYIGGGQADMQLLVVTDDQAETWQILYLNRDTMTEVPVLGVMGNVVSTRYEQLCLAHSYGDGMEESCINNVNTVSALLGDQEIDGYFSLNMDGVAILNDAVGGVTLTVQSDFSGVDDSLVQGETITLTGEQALTYVRTRKGVDDQTNLSRMERQAQYIKALFAQCRQAGEEVMLEAYDAVYDYLVTDMGSGGLVELAQTMAAYTELESLTIQGESYLDETGANAYELDPDSLERTILQLFYEQAAE
ncbi:MAG: LCP family protein [Lachnospiraceae bacterium]|nr:LCP family protein [Lachnospiraceae bacterium]